MLMRFAGLTAARATGPDSHTEKRLPGWQLL